MVKHILSARGLAVVLLLIFLALVPQLVSAFYINIYTRILIWAIAAISLNIILGYGGMISFGHAAYLGVAAYVVLIFSEAGITNGFIQWPVAIVVAGLIALVIGAICIRTRGVYFIMITLAFTQMIYFFVRGIDRYGGDDGMRIRTRSEFDLGIFELGLQDRATYYYVVFVLLLACLYFAYRLVNSRFGTVLRGSMSNDDRLQAIGVASYNFRLVAFVIAGMMGGLAGLLHANMEKFVSSELMNWTVSGDLIFIVVLGGTGRLFGPIFGAVAFWLLQEFLGDLTSHWKLIFGPFLVFVVLFARGGIDGLLETMDNKLRRRRKSAKETAQ
jgi:branched-chain amino acid transport system permease protein